MSSSDPLADYRRLAAERRNRLLGTTTTNNTNTTNTDSTINQSSSSITTSTPPPSPNNNNTTTTTPTTNININNINSNNTNNNNNTKKLKLIERSNEEIIKERESFISSNLISILNPNTEKKKYIEKLNSQNESILKREREEKEKMLKALRTDPHVGKKTKSIDYPNIDNSLKLNSPTKPNQVTETIFESQLEENEPCIIQIRFIDGSTNKVKFESKDKLTQICQYVFNSEKGNDYNGIKIKIPLFKIKYFNNTNMTLYNLKELELSPNGNLIIENDTSEFAFTRNDLKSDLEINQELNYLPVEYILQNFGASYRLKGDTIEEKEKFRDRLHEKEIEQAKLEKIQKKKEMALLRKRLDEDKKERLEKKASTTITSSTSSNSSSSSNSNSNNSNNSTSNVKSISNCNINTPCSIQVRLPNGNCEKVENMFGKNSLHDLYQQVVKQSPDELEGIRFEDLQFRRQYPNMDFDSRHFKKTTLLEAQLVPRGLIVLAICKK